MAELDPFEPDEESDEEDEGAQQGGSIDRSGESRPAVGADDDSSVDDTLDEPVQCTVSIARNSHGALLFNCYASSQELELLNISYIKDEKLVTEDSAESERKLLAMGVGPEVLVLL